MRKALALVSALLVMLASLAPHLARAQAAGAVVTVRDAETEALLRSIAHPLFRVAGVDPALVRITMIQARPINAFVTTGNRMFVNTGLIQQSEGVGDLVGVLAHETGHIAGGHVTRLPEEMRNALIRSIAGMLLGGAAAAAGGRDGGQAAAGIMLGSQAMAQAEFFAFTRSQEQAADQAGMTYLERLGWSGAGLARLLRRMQEQELLATGRQDPYFRTHPLSRDRMEFVTDWVARAPSGAAGGFPPGLEANFRLVRAKLDGFIDPPATTWRRYPESDGSAPARYARAIAQYRSGRTDAALAILEGLVRETPGSPWLRELQGQVLFEAGRVAESIPALREAARLAPGEALIRLALGRALMEAGGDPALLRAAVAELEASLRLERDSAFAWRQLGIAHGRLGQMPQADLALAEEAMLTGDFPTARLLARRAEAALPLGPLRLRAQDLRQAAQRDNLTREQREQEDALRRRRRP